MKKQLGNLIKTTKPLKDKISDLIKVNFSPSKRGSYKLTIFPLKNKLPTIDPEIENDKSPIIHTNEENKTESGRVKRQISQLAQSVDSTRKMMENILETRVKNENTSKVGNSVSNITNKKNMNSIENVFNRNDMNSLIQNISSTRNENTTASPNYIKSSVSIPFIKNETNNKNSDSSVSNIKVSKPTVSRFSNLTNVGSQFTKENKYYTNNIQSTLENSPAVKVFERGKSVLKSTKEVMNHITTRQNNVIPMLEYGGMVNSPTLAMIGESGPETVMPSNMPNRSTSNISPVPSPYKLTSPMIEESTKNNNKTNLKNSFDSINKSVRGSSDMDKMKLGTEKQNSITSLANSSLQERASYQAQTAANSMKPANLKDSPTTLQAKEFARPTTTKQTAPSAGAPGADAGSSPFSSYFRNRIFSLPSWRQRLS